ncbi:hypothetical protein GHT09_011871 [Marmota monax]|uniref:Uncharacterized protein n=1 Tax=Marmota monax TaxID=9995 RepID=A0A834QCS0_MARMO|nr:hypothetical protein GHT09_011871 [Marmota monax]
MYGVTRAHLPDRPNLPAQPPRQKLWHQNLHPAQPQRERGDGKRPLRRLQVQSLRPPVGSEAAQAACRLHRTAVSARGRKDRVEGPSWSLGSLPGGCLHK